MRFFTKLSSVAFAAFLLIGLSNTATAAPCAAGTLADYIALNQGGGCTIGDFTFFRFSFSAGPLENVPLTPSASDVNIAPISLNGDPGLGISSASLFQLSGLASATYRIGYTIDPPPIILGETLQLDPPFGDVRVTQNACLSDVLITGCTLGTSLSHFVTPTQSFSFLSFGAGSRFVDLLDVIELRSTPGNPAGFDSLNSAPSITGVPEPATVTLTALSGLALIALSIGRRKFKPVAR